MFQRYSLKSIPSFWCSHGEQCFAQVDLIIAFDGLWLKLKFRKYPAIHTNYIISHSTTLQGCHIFNVAWLVKAFPRRSPAIVTWPAYDDGRKRGNSSAWKHRIIVASTCRRSVEFGRYVTWLWVANCVSVMTKMLHLYNFVIPCHGRPAWKTSQCARATDWLNQTRPFSLGTMSASAYIENAA